MNRSANAVRNLEPAQDYVASDPAGQLSEAVSGELHPRTGTIAPGAFSHSDRDAQPLSNFEYFRRIRHDLLGGFDSRAFNEPIVERKFLWLRSFLVSHPDGIRSVLVDNANNYMKADLLRPILRPLIGDGLITSEGEVWKRHRRIMLPTFEAVREYMTPMLAVASHYAERWSRQEGCTIDLCAEMMGMTLDTISRTAFSSSSVELEALIANACARYWPELYFSPWTVVPIISKVWSAWRKARGRRALSDLDNGIYALIQERAQMDPDSRPSDLIGRLISARDQDKSVLSPEEIRDQVVTIFIVGHETTAISLTWTLYLLALHPEHESKIVAELNDVLCGRQPTFADLPKLTYTKMVLDEVLRLYPPAHTLGWRQALGDDEFCGTKIPKGSIVTISPWVLHRHRLLWDKPDEFLPERFSKENRTRRSRFSYIPFGVGPRVCIGAAFSVQEVLIALATLLPKFRFTLLNTRKVVPKGTITLHPETEIRMRVDRRGS